MVSNLWVSCPKELRWCGIFVDWRLRWPTSLSRSPFFLLPSSPSWRCPLTTCYHHPLLHYCWWKHIYEWSQISKSRTWILIKQTSVMQVGNQLLQAWQIMYAMVGCYWALISSMGVQTRHMNGDYLHPRWRLTSNTYLLHKYSHNRDTTLPTMDSNYNCKPLNGINSCSLQPTMFLQQQHW